MKPGEPDSRDVGASPLHTGPSDRPFRAVVIGGSGQIGSWLLWTLAQRGHSAIGTYSSVQFPGLVHLDASDLRAAADWVAGQAADVVFYPAGFTWVDGCERDRAALTRRTSNSQSIWRSLPAKPALLRLLLDGLRV